MKCPACDNGIVEAEHRGQAVARACRVCLGKGVMPATLDVEQRDALTEWYGEHEPDGDLEEQLDRHLDEADRAYDAARDDAHDRADWFAAERKDDR